MPFKKLFLYGRLQARISIKQVLMLGEHMHRFLFQKFGNFSAKWFFAFNKSDFCSCLKTDW